MEKPRDPSPADLSAEPEPADSPPAEAAGPPAARSAAGPEPVPAVPRPRDPGESAEPLGLGAFTQPLSVRPAVSFPVAGAPYLVGVITAAAPLVNSASPAPVSRPAAGHRPPAGCVSAE